MSAKAIRVDSFLDEEVSVIGVPDDVTKDSVESLVLSRSFKHLHATIENGGVGD
jgi:hypothetical protein